LSYSLWFIGKIFQGRIRPRALELRPYLSIDSVPFRLLLYWWSSFFYC
jgi:hypothetical protein